MNILLVKCESNWADEIDLRGFALYTEETWEEYLQLVKTRIFNVEQSYSETGANVVDIGTNQTVCYTDFESFKADFKTIPLSDLAVEILCSLFKLTVNTVAMKEPKSYGMFMFLNPAYYLLV